MKAKNPAAVKLGRLGRGKPKHFSKEELKRRAETMRQNQRKRWVNRVVLEDLADLADQKGAR